MDAAVVAFLLPCHHILNSIADRWELALDTGIKHSGDEAVPLALGGKRVEGEKVISIAEMVAVPRIERGTRGL